MPITQSAKKALRQNLRRRTKNIKVKEGYKKTIKEYKKLIAEKKLEEATHHLEKVYQVLDKAAKAGVMKSNKAARLKSRLARALRGSGSR